VTLTHKNQNTNLCIQAAKKISIDTKGLSNYGFIGKNRRDILQFLAKMDEKYPLEELRPELEYLKIEQV
jgi:hypothetical protein